MAGSVLNFYADRLEVIEIEGKDKENALVTRQGRSINPLSINNNKKVLLFADSKTECGDIITRKDKTRYFITSHQYSESAVECQCKRVNTHIAVYTLKKEYEEMELVGLKKVLVQYGVPAFEQDITAKMKSYDGGLLNQAIKSVLIKADIPVKVTDMIVLEDIEYMVINVDKVRVQNMLFIQLAEETRKADEE